jgi:nitrite reductase (NADH) small subunit/3-phenylpropionate/trans-cinnamate dioxygenase ferredoxin subunit
MPEFTTIAKVGDVPEGRGRTFTVGERRVAVFLVKGAYYAMNDACPHMGASLGVGDVVGDTVVCDRHLWAYRLADGVCLETPELQAETYEVRVEGDAIQVRLPPGEPTA